MAKSSTERMREKKMRDEKRRRKLADAAAPVLENPFSDWIASDQAYAEFLTPFDMIGLKPPQFEDERGPEEFMVPGSSDDPDPFPGAKGAVGRAEVIADYLLDAVWAITDALNRYKRQEIEARLAELESSNEADRATAMKEAVHLNKILDQLNKRVRRDFPQWKVTSV